MLLYREWCQRPNLRRGLMVKDQALIAFMRDRDSGYCSVFMFDEDAAKQIEESHNSRGLDQYEVYADRVFIDLDNGDADLSMCCDRLSNLGLGYSVYSSGSKGYHVTIPLKDVISGKNVPYSMMKWVEGLGVNFDRTIYLAGALIALPGRLHPKTRVPKRLIKTVDGKPLTLPIIDAPAPITFNLGQDSDALKRALTQLNILGHDEPVNGERHTSIWKTAKSLAEAGIELTTTLDLINAINNSWDNPKDEADVVQAVERAYD